jgi:hypothetical protein
MPHSLILRKPNIPPRLPLLATKIGEKIGPAPHESGCELTRNLDNHDFASAVTAVTE